VIRWDLVARGMPTQADIDAAVAKVKAMPGAGDQQHVQAVFPVYGHKIPATPDGAWNDATQKTVKLGKLQATNAQLDRTNLIWHLQHPGQSKMKSPRNTHPQVIKTNDGDRIIADGHHRLSAMYLLGLKAETCWVLKESDMT
jgi:hypothetical protein